jgi:hypothetical protein
MSISLDIFTKDELAFIFYVLNKVFPCSTVIDEHTIKAYRVKPFIQNIINSKTKLNKNKDSEKIYNSIINKLKNEYNIKN